MFAHAASNDGESEVAEDVEYNQKGQKHYVKRSVHTLRPQPRIGMSYASTTRGNTCRGNHLAIQLRNN